MVKPVDVAEITVLMARPCILPRYCLWVPS
jgi:hypothetical protein